MVSSIAHRRSLRGLVRAGIYMLTFLFADAVIALVDEAGSGTLRFNEFFRVCLICNARGCKRFGIEFIV